MKAFFAVDKSKKNDAELRFGLTDSPAIHLAIQVFQGWRGTL